MAKNKSDNNSLFTGFKPPKLDTTPKKKSEEKTEPAVKETTAQTEPAPDATVIVAPIIEEPKPKLQMPKSPVVREIGRPKELEGEYHKFQTRIREDLFSYAQSISGKGKQYQSVNAYLNELILKDMQDS